MVSNSRTCKYCRSAHVIKYGIDKGTQMYFCRDCQRKFARMDTIPQMHSRTADITEALNLYYQGLSLNDIRRSFIDQDNNYISKASIYNWIERFTIMALEETGAGQPEFSDQWILKEISIGTENNQLNTGGGYLRIRSARKASLWLLVDTQTGYILACQIVESASRLDFRTLIEKARRQAGKDPEVIFSDQQVLEAEAPEMRKDFSIVQKNREVTESCNDIMDERTRFKCALKKQSTLEKFMLGWIVQYNYFKSQNLLNNKTPAQTASLQLPFNSWKEVVERAQVNYIKKVKTLEKDVYK